METKMNTILKLVNGVLSIVANGCGYDQWRITSTKLSKYDTE